ncbi:MAG: hypothetical protein JXA11_12195 [Phycisphaerae bacterium]|nr:hypothetical protein [Phycisphaerae bacterium]
MDLLVLSHTGGAEGLTRLLSWARRRWRGSLQAVISHHGNQAVETAARSQGAMVFLPPMSTEDWFALFTGAKQANTVMATGAAV